eukprot:1160357-Pelagomonas_calceolata.AAC.2
MSSCLGQAARASVWLGACSVQEQKFWPEPSCKGKRMVESLFSARARLLVTSTEHAQQVQGTAGAASNLGSLEGGEVAATSTHFKGRQKKLV